MKQDNTKFIVGGVLAVIVVAGLVILNSGDKDKADKQIAKATPVVEGGSGPRGAARRSVGSDSDGSAKTPAPKPKETPKDRFHGLPPLTLENADINPEKPPEMPLADWEEYERQRYNLVQLKAYKFRETDPDKVVPYEAADVIPEAAKKYNIPVELLGALCYTSSDGGHHYAEHDIEGGFGLMMLKESPQCDSLGEAAQLLGVSKEDLIYNQRLNVHGAAAVLRQYFEDAKSTGLEDSEAWYMAVAQYSGRPQPELAAALSDQVAGNMMKGFEIDSEDGTGYYKQDPMNVPLFYPKDYRVAAVDPPPGGVGQAKEDSGAVPPGAGSGTPEGGATPPDGSGTPPADGGADAQPTPAAP